MSSFGLDSNSTETSDPSSRPFPLPMHVTILASYVPPHQLGNYLAYAENFKRLTILVSTMMERHRYWEADLGTLEFQLQKTWTIPSLWKHKAGFTDSVDIHFPVNTIQLLRKLDPDVVVSSELGFRSMVAAIYSAFIARKPFILWACVSEHSEEGRGFLRNKLRRWLIRRADAIIVNGKSGRRYIHGMGANNQCVYEIPYSARSGFYDSCPLERDEASSKKLLIVGQLIERKGVDTFLRILSRWAIENSDRRIELSVVGDGPLRESLEALPRPMNLSIDFLGRKTHEELRSIYANSGILAFPTLADEWGLVVNEAMAAGLPVLGSLYSGAVEELCTDEKTGWTFLPNDEGSTLQAIDAALNCSQAELHAMRIRCRHRVSDITPQGCAKLLADAIWDVMKQRKEGVDRGSVRS